MLRALAVAVVLVAPRLVFAQDAFEIQVYDAETAPPGGAGLETHINYVAVGDKAPSPDGQLATDHVTHLTFEPHVGLARWCEAGAYFQTAFRADGSFDYAGVKLRFKARLPRRYLHEMFGFALNVELSSVPPTYELSPLGGELRPVIDWRWRRLYASVNPIVGFDFQGPSAGVPQLEPAATVLVEVVHDWAMGVEYYGAYGPVNALLSGAEEVHRLFVVSTLAYKWFGLHVGGGYGFAAGDKWIAKAILSFDFETAPIQQAAR